MRRLFEHPTDQVTVREAYDVHRPRPPDRPWLGVCMVASIDGSTVIDSNSRALSSKTDQEVLLTLRDLADVLLVGAATVRIEGYGPPRKRGQRVGVVSRTGFVDVSTPLFSSGCGFLILPEDAPPTQVESVRAGVGEVDFGGALAQLHADFVQAEGGAQLNGALVDSRRDRRDQPDDLPATGRRRWPPGDQRLCADVASDAPRACVGGRRVLVHPLRARPVTG